MFSVDLHNLLLLLAKTCHCTPWWLHHSHSSLINALYQCIQGVTLMSHAFLFWTSLINVNSNGEAHQNIRISLLKLVSGLTIEFLWQLYIMAKDWYDTIVPYNQLALEETKLLNFHLFLFVYQHLCLDI